MLNDHQIGLIMLRVMVDEFGMKPHHRIQEARLIDATHLDYRDLRRAGEYMHELGTYIVPPINGSEYVLTDRGLSYLEQERKLYKWIPLSAEHILRWLVESEEGNRGAGSETIISALNIVDRSRFYKMAEYLERHGYIRDLTDGSGYYQPTEKGYEAVHDNFLRSTGSTTQIGALIGQMTGGTVQAVAAAYDSNIHQVINQTDNDALKQGISEAIEKLVGAVSNQLTIQQQANYLQAAAQLQQEVMKLDPDRGVIQQLVKVLSFGDTLNGALELGEKTLPLLGIAAPYVGLLAQAIEQLLNSLPN